MILSFKTKIAEKPTHFVEKIWSSLLQLDFELYDDYLHPDGLPSQMPWPTSGYIDFKPKLHTIRTDERDRWQKGILIDFFINARQKNMFRFAPQITVLSTQFVGIYHLEKSIEVAVDRVYLYPIEIEELALNDGFESVEDFFAYFNEDFHGKIIHWTDHRY